MVDYFRQIYANLRIRYKIFLGFAILVLISTQSISFYAGHAVRMSLERQIADSVAGILESTAIRFDDQFADMEQKILFFTRDGTIYSSLDGYATSDVLEKYDRWRVLYNAIATWKQSQNISAIRLFARQSLLFLRDGIQFIDDAAATASLERILSTTKSVAFRGNTDGTISVYCAVYASRTMERLAIVEFVFSAAGIQEQLCAVTGTTIESICLVADDGTVLISAHDAERRESILTDFTGVAAQTIVKDAGSNDISICNPLKNTPISLIARLPADYITRHATAVSTRIWLVGVAILGVAFILAWLISSSITRRLEYLKKAMRNLEAGDITSTMPQDSKDELGVILSRFSDMRARLDDITQEIYRVMLFQKETEFRLLQAQINPHFLYNTLDVIACSAASGEVAETEWLVRQLSSFMRLSITKSGEWSTVGCELKQVQAYWNIQNHRYRNSILLDIRVTNELLDEKIPPMLVQPLIENALKHGILPTESKCGLIELEIKRNGGDLIITVTDDGIGILPSKLVEIRASLTQKTYDGYGLWNIHQRIRNQFGEAYGLEIASPTDGGTRFTLTFPRVET